MIIKAIGNLAKEENVLIELKIGPDGAMSILVYGNGSRDLTIVCWEWSEETIMDAIRDTIRRVKGR